MFILTLAIFIVSFCNSSAKRLSFFIVFPPYRFPILILRLVVLFCRCLLVLLLLLFWDSSSCFNVFLSISISFFIVLLLL
uniref:Putative secreted peptide n=1 Tax=Anopheles braziliensis TaxID=58242 RepID=A0A2M3ZTP2_9DIPT